MKIMKTELKTGVLAVSSFFKISKATLLLDFLVFTSEDLTLSVHQSVRNALGKMCLNLNGDRQIIFLVMVPITYLQLLYKLFCPSVCRSFLKRQKPNCWGNVILDILYRHTFS